MRLNQPAQSLLRFRIDRTKRLRNQKFWMEPLAGYEGPVRVIHPRQPARHSRAKINSNPSQHRDDTSGHVLATVVANTFHNSRRPGVAYCKPLPGPTRCEQLASGSAIQGNIAQNHVLAAVPGCLSASTNHQLATRQTLTNKIVCLTL